MRNPKSQAKALFLSCTFFAGLKARASTREPFIRNFLKRSGSAEQIAGHSMLCPYRPWELGSGRCGEGLDHGDVREQFLREMVTAAQIRR